MNRKLYGEDAAWFHMESATNPMVVSGLIELESVLPIERARTLARRLTAVPRFSARIVEPPLHFGVPSWLASDRIDPSAHLEHVHLATNETAALRAFVGQTLSKPLDPTRPLWRLYLIDRPSRGTTLLFRVHHAIGDGVALLGVLDSLSGGGTARPDRTEASARGSRWRDLLRAARSLQRLLVLPPDPATSLHRGLGGEKRVAWSEPIPLSAVKQIGTAMSSTVNDVLVGVVAGALRRSLSRRGETTTALELHAMVPVDLRAPSAPAEVSNHFGLVVLGLPLGIENPLARILAVRQRMKLLKQSAEPAVTHDVLALLGYAPQAVETAVTRFFGKKASLVLTNLRGPTQRVRLARIPVTRMMFWVPEAAHLGLGISIFSYAGEVTVGVLADATVLPDPDTLTADFHAEFAAAEAACRAKGQGPEVAARVAAS